MDYKFERTNFEKATGIKIPYEIFVEALDHETEAVKDRSRKLDGRAKHISKCRDEALKRLITFAKDNDFTRNITAKDLLDYRLGYLLINTFVNEYKRGEHER